MSAEDRGITFSPKIILPDIDSNEFIGRCRPLAGLLDSVRPIAGFPRGKDKDILALSDPPFYTACPSPYLDEFIECYGRPYDPETDHYRRQPFAGDVSEGKGDPLYRAHAYHTKVPPKAIMKYIEHYTAEGDIIFDGFCGSGMTGVAAGLLNRRAILSDLSPAATFIAASYNSPADGERFGRETERILAEIEVECGWMYATAHGGDQTGGRINYTVWSDIFICPCCRNEYVFWEAAVDQKSGRVKKNYPCPVCRAEISKRVCERPQVTIFDRALNREVTQAKRVPVLINYSVGQKRYAKEPDRFDLDRIKKIEEGAIPYSFPSDRLPEGYSTEQPKRSHGLTHLHHFYTKRSLWILAAIKDQCTTKSLRLWFNSQLINLSLLNRYRPQVSFPYNPLSGTLYIASLISEANIFVAYGNKQKRIKKAFQGTRARAVVQTSSAQEIRLGDQTVDYIFTDPPFGGNIMYSELNFLWEAWLKVFTNNRSEAIVNDAQGKGLSEYKNLLTDCFKEMYRILKPDRWMTLVFHNSQASVWNALQKAIARAGFVVAQVTVLDKQQGSFKQVTSRGAVKNDLVISAYKPRQQVDGGFLKRAGEGLERDFVRDLLERLPVEPGTGRTGQMLFSRLLAHYVQRGYAIRLDARRFYSLLRDNFKQIDGCWFTASQVLKYKEWKGK